MSTVAAIEPAGRARRRPNRRRVNYLNVAYGVKSWLLTTDHKRIAILYLVTVTLMFFLGGAGGHASIRLQPDDARRRPGRPPTPTTSCSPCTASSWSSSSWSRSIPTVLGNFFLPHDDRRQGPRLPAPQPASWYLYIARRRLHPVGHARRRRRHRLDLLHAVQHASRRTPTSSRRMLGIVIAGFSSILTGLNFIVTIHRMRAPGLTWFRLPLFVWSLYATSIIILLGHAGAGHDADPGGHRAHLAASASSTRPWAATRCCSSTCSGSTRTRPSTS